MHETSDPALVATLHDWFDALASRGTGTTLRVEAERPADAYLATKVTTKSNTR
ncbi:MAG: hypothetical protein H0T55_03585 [Rubrobacteraceae bacterium]|nr:hypothetical protein [Rubrobacteraceae bacterium]MBA3615400.1 hypothetical protein [Rubrobacteraceae bacterium]MDQ3251107.1 hypothetical protein [Actinomycetota bacterium]MDQ3438526.1 hypothetical protein [Actinomycetota bacterium]